VRSALHRALAFLLLAAVAAGCTGSRETRTPVVAFVAGGDEVRAFLTGLPREAPGDPALTPLPDLTRSLPPGSTILDLAAVPEGRPALYLLYHDASNVDRLARFDLDALDPNDAASVSSTPDAEIDLTALASGIAILAEPLCAAAIDVASDGAWLGLLHEPGQARCGGSGSPAVLAIELLPDDPADRRVRPTSAGTNDASATPTFVGTGDDERLAWLRTSGEVALWSPDAPDAPASETAGVAGLGGDAPSLGRAGTGLALADGDELTFVPLGSAPPGPTWTIDGLTTIDALVAADGLPGVTAVGVADGALVLATGLDGEPDEERVGVRTGASAAAAVLDPYGYLLVATPLRIEAYDALTALDGAAIGVPVARADLVLPAEPVGVVWTFVSR
jgi:hypothetical protein